MSAFVCDKSHLVFIVQSAMRITPSYERAVTWYHNEQRHSLGQHDLKRAAEVVNMLMMENIRSVSYRYPDCKSSSSLPGPSDMMDICSQRDFKIAVKMPDLAQLFKSIDCLCYQSCETPDWEKTESFAFLQSVRQAAWHSLPGYESAKWGGPND